MIFNHYNNMNNLLFYFLIFIAEAINLMMVTVRAILTSRGEKLLNTICGFIQTTVYVIATAYVLVGITEDIYRAVAYILGCAFGCYMGMVVDDWFAIGKNMLTVIVDRKDGDRLATLIRERGFALTTMEAQSSNNDKSILMIGLKRKKEKKLIHSILENEKDAVIVDESINTVGGYY